MKFNRRNVLTLTGGAIGAALATQVQGAEISDNAPAITRIAWGSCANQDKEQPIWDAIAERKPELFLFIGDNIYADTRDKKLMAKKYQTLANKPEFKRFRDVTPFLTIWDDHDYGEDDAGREYPMKDESRKQFCDFWNVPANSERRTREDGIYTAEIFGAEGKRVQIILPDLRWNRTSLRKIELGGKSYKSWATARALTGKSVPGPYDRNPDDNATMLGDKQWQWLEKQLMKPAELRIFASSLQVVADFAGWESWINFYNDHQRLLDAIRKYRANGLFCISGDTHYAEISRLDMNVPYPLWDFTSSGITEVWPVLPPNNRRIGDAYRKCNFGMIEIDWNNNRVKISIHSEKGEEQISQTLKISELSV